MSTIKQYGAVSKTTIICDKRPLSFYRPRTDQKRYFFQTSDVSEQEEIESHPWFKSGEIYLIAEIEQPNPKNPVIKVGPETPAVETGAGSNEGAGDTGSDQGAGSDEGSGDTGANTNPTGQTGAGSNEGEGDTGTDETPTNQTIVNNQGQDEELLAVTSTQKAIVYLTGKGFDAAAIGKDKQAVIDFAATKNITFPNWK